jgi:hypothetical protein
VDIRDRTALALLGNGTLAAFAGSWIRYGLGVALLVVAGLAVGGGLLLTATGGDTTPQIEAQGEGAPIAGEAPERARVVKKAPFALVRNAPAPVAGETTHTEASG